MRRPPRQEAKKKSPKIGLRGCRDRACPERSRRPRPEQIAGPGTASLLLSGLYRRLRSSTGSCAEALAGCTADRELGLAALTLPRRLELAHIIPRLLVLHARRGVPPPTHAPARG